MPITSTISPEHRLIDFVISGILSGPEMVATVDAVVAGIGGQSGYRVFSDHRQIERAITTEELHGLLLHLRSHARVFGGGRWAILTAHAASYGMMRMLSVLAQQIPMDVQVFTDAEEARRWLNAPGGAQDERT